MGEINEREAELNAARDKLLEQRQTDLLSPDSGEETPMVGAGQQQSRVVRIVSKQSNV